MLLSLPCLSESLKGLLSSKGSVPLSSLDDAFGPSSLGIIIVKDLPQRFQELRGRVLSYSSYLANLPEHELGILHHLSALYII